MKSVRLITKERSADIVRIAEAVIIDLYKSLITNCELCVWLSTTVFAELVFSLTWVGIVIEYVCGDVVLF